ncbi:MAG: hypothetical protein WAK75_03900 [Methanoregula sp.]|uniref:hypothetical protein n=1 Tax=Methanoregula sp. TaxID=2052170 RepID=UPI003BD5FDE3
MEPAHHVLKKDPDPGPDFPAIPEISRISDVKTFPLIGIKKYPIGFSYRTHFSTLPGHTPEKFTGDPEPGPGSESPFGPEQNQYCPIRQIQKKEDYADKGREMFPKTIFLLH